MTFGKDSGFIFAMVGSAIGFANILSFSAQCYKNGGGAFLIPFLLAVVIIGLPMLYLEGVVGKVYGLPLVSAYGKILPNRWKIWGWIAVLSCLTIGSFYTVLTSWSVLYSLYSLTDSIPADTASFFVNDFLKDSGSVTTMGSMSWPIFGATLVLFVFTWYIMAKDVSKGVEKACSFFMPLLFVLFGVFTIAVIFLPGASIGFYHYLNPDFSKLSDFRLWRDVFGHVFFSFSLGLGIVVGYSRHTKTTINMRRAMLLVALGDVVFSFIAGLAVFGCVGFMSLKTSTPFHEIVKSDSTFQMGFIIFPQILQTFSPIVRPLVGGVFFFCVFIAGITGVFSIVESVAGNLEVEFGMPRKSSVTLSVIGMFVLASFFCMGNGVHLLAALQPWVLGYALLLGGIAQIYAFMFVDKTVGMDPAWSPSKGKPGSAYFTAKYIGLIFLVLSLVGSLFEEFNEPFSASHVIRWAWFFLVLLLSAYASGRVHRAHEY